VSAHQYREQEGGRVEGHEDDDRIGNALSGALDEDAG
jgi:hypothetical protein